MVSNGSPVFSTNVSATIDSDDKLDHCEKDSLVRSSLPPIFASTRTSGSIGNSSPIGILRRVHSNIQVHNNYNSSPTNSSVSPRSAPPPYALLRMFSGSLFTHRDSIRINPLKSGSFGSSKNIPKGPILKLERAKSTRNIVALARKDLSKNLKRAKTDLELYIAKREITT